MNKFKSITEHLILTSILILSALIVGCGGGGEWHSSVVAAAPTVPGVGTGTGGLGRGPAPVILGASGNYVILSKTEVTTTDITKITGDIGISPAAASFITGFGLVMDPTGCFSTSSLVTGKVYAADYSYATHACATATTDTASILTIAVNNMSSAYADAAGRTPDFTEIGGGNISGMTLPAGTYKWSTDVLINSDLTLNGGPNDVWIFEISKDIKLANGIKVTLTGGALSKNIFWQVAGGTGVTIGTSSHIEGVIIAAKAITLKAGATANGKMFAQTAVTLNANTLTQ